MGTGESVKWGSSPSRYVCVCVALMSDTYLWSPSSLVKAGSEAIDTPFDVRTHKRHPLSYHTIHSPLFLSGPKHTHFSIN